MKTEFIHYELPEVLPHGWRKAVASRLKIHRNTVKEAIKRGGEDETYKRIMHTAAILFGKPTKSNSHES